MANFYIKDYFYARHRKGTEDVLYELSDVDEALTSTTYCGYLNNTGGWIIIRYYADGGVTQIRFAIGDSDYTTNWANRTGLTYKLYSELFEV